VGFFGYCQIVWQRPGERREHAGWLLPGDVKQMIAAAHDQYVRPIEQRLGYQGPSPETMQQVYAQAPSLTPTGPQLSRLMAALLGPPHQPQTAPGDLAYTVGEKIPGLPLFLAMRGR
jgi:hypothetical protein